MRCVQRTGIDRRHTIPYEYGVTRQLDWRVLRSTDHVGGRRNWAAPLHKQKKARETRAFSFVSG